MKKISLGFVCLALCIVSGNGVDAEENDSAKTLPPVIAQTSGPALTIIMWHDIDDDGNADYRATYAFIEGRLRLLEKNLPSSENPGQKRMFVN
jgi:hypothetical protein